MIISWISSLSSAQHLDSGDKMVDTISSQATCSSSNSSESFPQSLESTFLSLDISQSVTSSDKPLRVNEHLAVLLPKHLWKPDSQVACCDTFLCRKGFTIFERRHHCRKCGGVFCAECSPKGTTLLDTSNLEFLHPPRHTPITAYSSPTSPVVFARVCNECYDQIHGRTQSHSPVSECSAHSQQVQESSRASSPSSARLSAQSRRVFKRPYTYTSPIFPQSSLHASPPASVINGSHISDSDLGELAAYPLRYASAICKATGGGRWEPKPVNLIGYHPYGMKLPYEIELEREEDEERRLRENPIFKNGDFQLRVPQEPRPRSLGGPITLSTF